MNIVQVTDDTGRVVEPAWLKRAERVHRQLRTDLPADYEGKMKRVFVVANAEKARVGRDLDGLRQWLAQRAAVIGVETDGGQDLSKVDADVIVVLGAGGARMCVATEAGAVRGVAVYRINENTFEGLHLYVDDLVTDEKQRSRGVGRALMEHLQGLARAADCEACTLDSGTQRVQAHKFYFREGMVVSSFHFRKPLK